MKHIAILLAALFVMGSAFDAEAQHKEKLFGKPYAKKKFWKNDVWAFSKFGVHFKVISTELSYGGSANQSIDARSWAMLEGVTEETMQRITDNFSERFKQRMKDEFGVTVKYWEDIKGSPGTEKVADKAADDTREFMHKSRGAMLTFSPQDSPWYKRLGGIPPGYKKIGKAAGGAATELDVVIDFSVLETQISTTKDYGWHYTTVSTNVKQGIVPLVHISTGMLNNTAPWVTTTFAGMDPLGSIVTFSLAKPLEADMLWDQGISTHKGEMPTIMKRRLSLSKPDMVSTFVVQADEARFEAAVNQALDTYLDELVKAIKAERE